MYSLFFIVACIAGAVVYLTVMIVILAAVPQKNGLKWGAFGLWALGAPFLGCCCCMPFPFQLVLKEAGQQIEKEHQAENLRKQGLSKEFIDAQASTLGSINEELWVTPPTRVETTIPCKENPPPRHPDLVVLGSDGTVSVLWSGSNRPLDNRVVFRMFPEGPEIGANPASTNTPQVVDVKPHYAAVNYIQGRYKRLPTNRDPNPVTAELKEDSRPRIRKGFGEIQGGKFVRSALSAGPGKIVALCELPSHEKAPWKLFVCVEKEGKDGPVTPREELRGNLVTLAIEDEEFVWAHYALADNPGVALISSADAKVKKGGKARLLFRSNQQVNVYLFFTVVFGPQ